VSPTLPRRVEPVKAFAFAPSDRWHKPYTRPRVARFLIRQFARLYYARYASTVFDTRFLGIQTLKYPTDLWTYQEIISETLPEVIIETGTWHGGSALFLAMVCDVIGHGRVVTIDVDQPDPLPQHARIAYLHGSSTDPGILTRVRELTDQAQTVMVILDSDHGREHVLAELKAYSDLVTIGSYLIVEDTNVNGHPVHPGHGPGPSEAVSEFLSADSRYVVDRTRERFLITANPNGFLRRVT
jgi:cephalosporin hydroxylase